MALVSIIIPVHDAGRYLDPCLDAVLGQSHRDVQVVGVDDGSSDGSTAVLRRRASRDGRLEVVHQAHAGPGAARNTGLGRAVGEYLMFVDADDLIPPDAVERHVDALRSSTADFSTGRVLRLAGTYRSPSPMHDNALSGTDASTHLYRDRTLLFDTTSWNKLFRRAHWVAQQYAYPEDVLFEDVALMTEAHCRASSVEILPHVVYWWRRRDDGSMSITMRRDDPRLLADRVLSLQRVRRLLAAIAPAAVRRAAETKFLRHDLGSYLPDLEDAPPDFSRDFVRIVRPFLEESPDSVVDRLPPHLRVAFRLVSQDRPVELVEFLTFLRGHGGRLPVRHRFLWPRTYLGPARSLVPRKLGSALRRLPLRLSVTSLSWDEDTLVIEGVGFIDGVPLGNPLAALRRLQLIDPRSGQRRHVWLGPSRLKSRGRGAPLTPSYEWSAFRAHIPTALLEPDPTSERAQWQLNLQVLAWGAASGSALLAPEGAGFVGVHRDRSGLLVRPAVVGHGRLVLEVSRPKYTVVGFWRDIDQLGLALRRTEVGDGCSVDLRLSPDIGRSVDVALQAVPADAGAGEVRVLIDPLVLTRGGARSRSFGIEVVGADGRRAAVTTDLENEVAIGIRDDTFVVAPDGRGGAELFISGPRTVVTAVTWAGTDLQVDMCGTGSTESVPGVSWCHEAGHEIYASLRRRGSTSRASFDLLAVHGPDEPRPVAAGRWTLMARHPDGSRQPVAASRGGGATAERYLDGVGWIRIGSDARGHASMLVEVLTPLDRSAINQEQLQRGAHRGTRRTSLIDVILMEEWGGKTFADSPRALLGSASLGSSGATVAVVVADRSIPVPSGVRAVLAGSRDHHELRATAKLIISNDSLPPHHVKRPGQSYLQTWHGTPLKRIGLDIERIRFPNKNYRRDMVAESAKWDWLVSPNAYTTEIFRRALAYEGPILQTGSPRNDVLAGLDAAPRAARRDHVRRWLGINPDQLVVLWAPTWRDDAYHPGRGYGPTILPEPADLERLLPRGAVLLFRGHHLLEGVSPLAMPGRVCDVSGYADVRDLLLVSDVLVTDYCSLVFDYALTDRPIVFYVPDLSHYQQIRGLYLDLLGVAPGPVTTSVDELGHALRSVSELGAEFGSCLAEFRRQFCSLEDGAASERVWAAVWETIDMVSSGSGRSCTHARRGR